MTNPIDQQPRFVWCCENGCGTCATKRIEFEYWRSEDMATGQVATKSEPRLVSACCGAGLSMWDNERDEEIHIQEAR